MSLTSIHPLAQRLARVRRRLRTVALVRGISRLVAVVVLVLLVGGLLDWWLHLPGLIRAFFLTGALSAAGVIVYRHVVRPLGERVDDLSLALKVESFYPDLNDSLASTIEFLRQGELQGEGSALFRRAAVQQALRETEGCDFTQVVDRRGVRSASLAMAAAAGVALTLLLWQPEAVATALGRLAEPFGTREWPPKTRLVLDPSIRTRIARGEPFEVRAELFGVIPEHAVVRFWFDGSTPSEQTVLVKRLPDRPAKSGEDEVVHGFAAALQPYRVQKSFCFQVQAYDAQTPWIAVTVLPPPALVPLDGKPSPQFRLRFPSYTDLPPHVLAAGTSGIETVLGTQVSMRAATDRPLSNAWIEYHPDQPGVKQASVAGLLAARSSLTAVALAGVGQTVWGQVPVERKPHGAGNVLQAQFVPWISGTYALRLVDESELTGTRLFDVRLFPDPPPRLVLERPSASFDSLAVLADATVTLRVAAEDPQYALRSVWLEVRCGRDAPTELRSLYHHIVTGDVWPSILSALAARPIPAPHSALRLRPQRLLIAQRLPLSRIRHADDRPLRDGDVVVLQACADDFDDWTVGKPPGKSQEVELHIVSRPALEALLHRAQEQVQQELQRLREQQRDALAKVEEIEKQWRATGKLRPEDIDNLLQAEQVQQQVRGRVGNEQEGLRAEVARIQQTLKDNNLPRSGTGERMDMVGRELDRLAQQELPQIEPRLTEARKENEQAPNPPQPERRNRSALAQAKEHQQEVERTLTDMLAALDPFSSSRQAQAEARALLQEQRRLAEQTDKLAKSIPAGKQPQSNNPDERLKPDEKAALDKAAQEQERLAEHTKELLNRLESLAAQKRQQADEKSKQAAEKARLQEEKERQAEQERPNNPAKAQDLAEEARALRREAERLEEEAAMLRTEADQLAKAAQVGRTGGDKPMSQTNENQPNAPVDERMKQAAQELAQNQLNKAGKEQQQSAATLEELAKTLENRREQELDQLVKKMKKAEADLARLVEEQDRLQKKVKEAQKIEDPKKRAEELERLARDQERLRKEARELAQRLSRMQAGGASQSLRQAGNQMDEAGQQLEQGENAEDQQDEALDRLEEAQEELQKARENAEEQLARERLQKIADQIKQLKERHEAQLAESERIHRELLQRKGWDRGLLGSLKNQPEAQRPLAQEAVDLAEKKIKDAPVFVHILRRTAEAMERAADSMKERLDAARDRAELDPATEEMAFQKTKKLQQEALALLQQLLDVLKSDDVAKAAGGGGQGNGGWGGDRDGDGIPPLAELKLLKALQQAVNRRTEEFARDHPDAGKLADEHKKQLDDIRKEQAVISDLLDKVTAPEGDKP